MSAEVYRRDFRNTSAGACGGSPRVPIGKMTSAFGAEVYFPDRRTTSALAHNRRHAAADRELAVASEPGGHSIIYETGSRQPFRDHSKVSRARPIEKSERTS